MTAQDHDWRVIRVRDAAEFDQVRGWVSEAIEQWYDVLRDPDHPEPVATMVANVATCLPNVWILACGDRWLGMGCLVPEPDGTFSAHGVMSRDTSTGQPIRHRGMGAVMREMVHYKTYGCDLSGL